MASTALPRRTSRSGYSRVAIAFHWTIAALILGNIAGGLLHESVSKETGGLIMAVHKSIGLTVLVLSAARLAWRVAHGFPRLPDSTSAWDALLARTTHVIFYFMMIAVPLAGWTMVSAGTRPLTWFGLFDVPKLPVSESLAGKAGGAHEVLALTTLALVILHVAGALKHQFIDKDDVLHRMLPWVRQKV